MDAAQIASLVTAITALIGAVSAVLAQIGHIRWHATATRPARAVVPPAPEKPDQK